MDFIDEVKMLSVQFADRKNHLYTWTFINSAPRSSAGREFGVAKQIPGGIHLNVSHNAKNIIRCSKRLLTHYAIEHDAVELQFE